jgi:hypothetical protein
MKIILLSGYFSADIVPGYRLLGYLTDEYRKPIDLNKIFVYENFN